MFPRPCRAVSRGGTRLTVHTVGDLLDRVMARERQAFEAANQLDAQLSAFASAAGALDAVAFGYAAQVLLGACAGEALARQVVAPGFMEQGAPPECLPGSPHLLAAQKRRFRGELFSGRGPFYCDAYVNGTAAVSGGTARGGGDAARTTSGSGSGSGDLAEEAGGAAAAGTEDGDSSSTTTGGSSTGGGGDDSTGGGIGGDGIAAGGANVTAWDWAGAATGSIITSGVVKYDMVRCGYVSTNHEAIYTVPPRPPKPPRMPRRPVSPDWVWAPPQPPRGPRAPRPPRAPVRPSTGKAARGRGRGRYRARRQQLPPVG